MDFGSVLGSVVGGVGSIIGSVADNIQREQAATVAFERSKEFYKNRHQWEVKDLQKAGLNPILSAGGQPPSSSAAMASGSDYQAGASGAVNSAISVLNAAVDLQNKESQNAILNQQRYLTRNQAEYWNEKSWELALQNDFYKKHPEVYRDLMVNSARPSNVWGLGYNIFDAIRSSDFGRSVKSFFGGD